MPRVVLHPQARAELLTAAVYYESSRVGLGMELLDEAEATLSRIAEHPDIGRVLRDEFRRLLLLRFPYGVIYRTSGETIYVVAVMHLRRKPGYWLARADRGGKP